MHPYLAYHSPAEKFPEDMTRVRAFTYACAEVANEEEVAKLNAGGSLR